MLQTTSSRTFPFSPPLAGVAFVLAMMVTIDVLPSVTVRVLVLLSSAVMPVFSVAVPLFPVAVQLFPAVAQLFPEAVANFLGG